MSEKKLRRLLEEFEEIRGQRKTLAAAVRKYRRTAWTGTAVDVSIWINDYNFDFTLQPHVTFSLGRVLHKLLTFEIRKKRNQIKRERTL